MKNHRRAKLVSMILVFALAVSQAVPVMAIEPQTTGGELSSITTLY